MRSVASINSPAFDEPGVGVLPTGLARSTTADSVGTRNVPRARISFSVAAEAKVPCSTERTPARTESRIPSSPWPWHITPPRSLRAALTTARIWRSS